MVKILVPYSFRIGKQNNQFKPAIAIHTFNYYLQSFFLITKTYTTKKKQDTNVKGASSALGKSFKKSAEFSTVQFIFFGNGPQ